MSSESTLGAYLRRRRERSGLSVEAVAAGSRIVPRLVVALEADRHDLLPAPVYVRGFVRAYCEQVGIDPSRALSLYDAQAVPDPPLTVRPATPSERPRPAFGRWRRVAVGSVLVAAVGVAAVAVLARRQSDAVAGRGQDTRVTAAGQPVLRAAASASPEPSAPPAPTPTPAVSAAPETPPVAASPAPAERVLLVRAVETTWVKVTPDGAPPTEETLSPGTVREWRSAGRFRVSLGNAGGVEVEFDGRPLPALGPRGQVVHRTIPDEARP
jgi:cytoskeleton protein RodZ